MPSAILNFEPQPIPGLFIYGRGGGKWEVRGSMDAIEAAGGRVADLKHAVDNGWHNPQGITLRDFQKYGVSRVSAILKRSGGAILADEMGLGKTVQAAIVGEYLRGVDGRTLVVCPAAVRHQWEKWMWAVNPDIADLDHRCANLGPISSDTKKGGMAATRAWASWLDGRATTAVVSYNQMAQALAGAKPKPRVLILDEFHNYLQSRGNTYQKTLWKYGAQVQYKLGLTGSPYLSKPAGLWVPLNCLLGLRFGKAHDFDTRYCAKFEGKYGPDRSGTSHPEELARRLGHYMVRRMKADVASELPKVTRVTRWVEGTKEAAGAMASMNYTSQGMRSAQGPTLDAKIPEVVSVAKEADAPCVVFCWRREDAEKVGAALNKAHQTAMVIHGAEDAAVRARRVAEATDVKAHVVTTYGASATGLDGLQLFISNSIHHSIDPVPTTLLQSIARLDRIGQTSPVTATFVAMRNSVDEITMPKVVDRLDVFQTIMGKDVSSSNLRDALMNGGVGDIDNDQVLQAIFDSIT